VLVNFNKNGITVFDTNFSYPNFSLPSDAVKEDIEERTVPEF